MLSLVSFEDQENEDMRMSKFAKAVSIESTFGTYTIDEILGEGGAGRVYGGVDSDGAPVAVKVLAEEPWLSPPLNHRSGCDFGRISFP